MSERDNMDLTPEERRLQESVRGLGEVRADGDFRAKLRAQFVSGEFAGEQTSAAVETDTAPRVVELPVRRRRWPVFAVPAIAAMLWVVVFSGGKESWRLEDVRGTGTVTIGAVTAAADDAAAVADLIQPATRITVPEGVEIDVTLGDVMVLGVAGPASFTLPEAPQKEPFLYSSTVHDGEFRFKSGPGFPGREILLLTTEGKIEITGTTVAVFKNDEVTCVCVLEGTARIGRDSDHMDAVPAGMRKVMFADGREPMIVPIEPGHRDNLIDFATENADTFD